MLELIRNMLHSLTINALSKNLSTAKNGKALDLKVNKDVEYELMSILYDLQRHTTGLEVDDVVAYVDVCLLLSKRTVKMLTKEQMLILVSRVASALESESVKLLAKALVDNDATVLCSKHNVNVGLEQRDCLQRALTSLVRSYLL